MSSKIISENNYNMSFDKEEILIFESNLSNVNILHLGSLASIVLALVITLISMIEYFIKGLFIYYVKYNAPENRAINKMILYDQVITNF